MLNTHMSIENSTLFTFLYNFLIALTGSLKIEGSKKS